MRSGGNDFDYFKLTKLVNFVQFKCMLCFVWRIGGLPPLAMALCRDREINCGFNL